MLRYKHPRTIRTQFKVVILALLVSLFTVSTVFEVYNFYSTNVEAASASDASGPKESWLGNHKARYRLENSSNVSGAGTQYIPIYIENTGSKINPSTYPPTNVQIKAGDFSKGHNGGVFSNARFVYCEGTPYRGSTGYTKSGATFTIRKECFRYVPTVSAWTTDIKAELQGNSGGSSFRLDFIYPNDGHQLFGYSTKNGQRGFAVSNRYRCDYGGDTTGCGKFYNYRIPFGIPCSEKSALNVTASIWDGDNTLGGPYNIQYNRYFEVSIYDVTTNRVVPHSTTGTAGNNTLQTYHFRVEPDHRYQFRVDNVYTNNVLQFRLPFNSIEYYNDCSWNLSPMVTVNPDASEGATNNLSVEYFMPNEGPATSDPVRWQLSRCIVDAGTGSAAYSQVADNNSNGTTTYNALGASCSQVTSKTNQSFATSTVNKIGGLTNQSIPDLAPGARVCYVLSVNPPTDDAPNNRWRHSTPACVMIVKKPKVQVWGGDLIVGKNNSGPDDSSIEGATTTKRVSGVNRTYGSWVEYAIAAVGNVSGVGSGSAYNQGNTSSAFCAASLLTFTNAGSGTCTPSTVKGQYGMVDNARDVSSGFSADSTSLGTNPSVNLATLGSGQYTATGTINVSASGDIAKGHWVVINAPQATVTISGNVKYSNEPLNSPFDIPQVVIIANAINIRESVTQVDAWLIASGSSGVVNTCSNYSVTAALTDSTCDKRLTINGPVVADKLYLRRTAGSGTGTSTGDPAEVINLRPDAYLWAIGRTAESGRLQASYIKELPPRF